MRAFLVSTLTGLLFVQASSPKLTYTTSPVPPPNSTFTAVVVVNITVDATGSVQRVSTITGAPPFLQASLDAVRDWKFTSANSADKQRTVNVTFLYRSPQLFSYGGSGMQLPGSTDTLDRPAAPIAINDADYPVNSVAEGAVILELKISAEGVL